MALLQIDSVLSFGASLFGNRFLYRAQHYTTKPKQAYRLRKPYQDKYGPYGDNLIHTVRFICLLKPAIVNTQRHYLPLLLVCDRNSVSVSGTETHTEFRYRSQNLFSQNRNCNLLHFSDIGIKIPCTGTAKAIFFISIYDLTNDQTNDQTNG